MNYYLLLLFLFSSSVLSQTTTVWPAQLHNPFMSDAATPVAKKSIVIPLQYINPKELESVLKSSKAPLLSPQAFFMIQEKEHTIWVQGTADDITTIKNLITAVDRPRRQLLLKARIVSIDNNFVHDLGALFQSSSVMSPSSPANNAMGSFTIPIANLQDGYLLDVKLNALEKNGHAKIESSPELVTLDHDPATIESGEEIPYQQETLSGGTAVSFKKAVLKLQVTPHILPNHHILLDIQVNQDKVSLLTVQGVPAIHTQQLSTEIAVKNKQTFVLGGVYEEHLSNENQGVPYLKDIPLLGYLFRDDQRVSEQRDMLVFVTVEVI